MTKVIRLTESDLRNIIVETVETVLSEYSDDPVQREQELSAWKEYDDSTKRDRVRDDAESMFDMNISSFDLDGDMAHSYVMDDPLYKKVNGTTLRHRLKGTVGNGIGG